MVLLVLSATGLTWSTYAGARFDLVQEAFNSASREPDTALPTGGDHSGHTGSRTSTNVDLSDVDTALATVRNAGLTGPVEMTPAGKPGQAWTVAQADNVWPVRRDIAAVDPGSGTVTDRVPWSDQPVLAQLSSLGVQAHMGILFGPVNQIVLAGAAIGPLAMIVWAYRMWWQRRQTRADRRHLMGDPPARGNWRQLPRGLLVVGVLGVAALCWAIPLLGWTLVAFLLIDAVAGLIHRRSANRTVRA